jgi:aconitase B
MRDQSVNEWTTAVETELGLEDAIDSEQGLHSLDGLAEQVARHVGEAAVGRTAFLVGIASGRASEPAVAAQDIAQKLSAMAQGWNSDAERGVPPNEQSRRA